MTSSDHTVSFMEGALIQLLDHSHSKLTAEEFVPAAYRGLHSTIKCGEVTVERLEAEIQLEISRMRAQKRRKYYALTRCHFGLPIYQWLPFEVWDVRLVFTPHAPRDFDLSEFFLSGYGWAKPNEPFPGAYCVVPVRARSASAALSSANEHLAVALGVLNFWLKLGSWSSYIGKAAPAAKLLPGNELFVYDETLELDKSVITYHVTPQHGVKSISGSDANRLSSLQGFLSVLEKQKGPKRAYFRAAFRLYFEALSEAASDDKVLRLWKFAEFLTFSQGADAAVTSKRLSVTWPERDVAHAVCSALAHRRNWIAHNEALGTSVDEVEEVFRNIVEHYLWVSLSPEVKSLDSWRVAVQLTADHNLSALEEGLRIAKKLG